jgi:hypothetical protein
LRQLDASIDTYVLKMAGDPVDVGRTVTSALATRRPRFRYAVGPTAKFNHFARGKLPSTLVRKLIGHYLGINRVRW